MKNAILPVLAAGALAFAMAVPAFAGGDTDMTAHPFARGNPAAHGLGNPGRVFGFSDRDRGHYRDHDRRDYRGHYRHRHRGFYMSNGYGWYNGHRGYRHWRRGYHQYNGWWFPGAVLGGAIVGSIIASEPHYAYGSAHVRWCYDHYRSYRASDNTYQPYHGPRRQCVSP